jgi:DNA-binding IclR family transcriptional regulator
VLQCIELKAHTERTVTRLDALEAELRAIRKEQVSFDREEFLIGVVCAAVPIIGRNGEILAALAVQGPEARMNVERAREHLPVLRKAARDLADVFQAQAEQDDKTDQDRQR